MDWIQPYDETKKFDTTFDKLGGSMLVLQQSQENQNLKYNSKNQRQKYEIRFGSYLPN